MPSTRAFSLLSATVLIISACVAAQDSATGAIRGTVMDASGGRIAQASIAVVNTATGTLDGATSDNQGRFAIEMLAPGDYSLRVEAQGMLPQVTPLLHVSVGGIAELEFRLKRGRSARKGNRLGRTVLCSNATGRGFNVAG